MRFMMLVIPKVYQGPSDPNFVPSGDLVQKMMQYNEDLAKAGVLVALDGLHPPEKGFRVSRAGAKQTVRDGPFAEAKEVLGGYTMIQVKSVEEAKEWAKRMPLLEGDLLEVRQVFEMTEFPTELQTSEQVQTVQAALDKRRG